MISITKRIIFILGMFLGIPVSFAMDFGVGNGQGFYANQKSNGLLHIQKPNNMGWYDWYMQKITQQVDACERMIYRSMGMSDQDWENTKRRCAPLFFFFPQNKLKLKPMPNDVADIVYNFLRCPILKKYFNFKKVEKIYKSKWVEDSNGFSVEKKCIFCVRALTESNSISVMIIDDPECTMRVQNNNIFINLNNVTGENFLELGLGHELGHIYFQHAYMRYCLLTLYKQKRCYLKNRNFNKDFLLLQRLQEQQADFFSFFNDLIKVKNAEKIFRKEKDVIYIPKFQERVYNFFEVKKNSIHPEYEERINCCRELADAMEKELGIIFSENYDNLIIQGNSISSKLLFDLGKKELELGDFKKAFLYFSFLYNNFNFPNKYDIWLLMSYALAHIKLKENNVNQAEGLFLQLLDQQSNNFFIKDKSCLELGYIYKYNYNNIKEAENYFLKLFGQTFCNDVRKKVVLELFAIEQNRQKKKRATRNLRVQIPQERRFKRTGFTPSPVDEKNYGRYVPIFQDHKTYESKIF